MNGQRKLPPQLSESDMLDLLEGALTSIFGVVPEGPHRAHARRAGDHLVLWDRTNSFRLNITKLDSGGV